MKKIMMIGILSLIVMTQTTVSPSQGCACTNLLNQNDCMSQSGCIWSFSNTTNSTTNQIIVSTTEGTCAIFNSTSTITLSSSYCSRITNTTSCAQTLGCANFNNSCTIYTGCSAYVQQTNQACQEISNQCTTDGTKCVNPQSCNNYMTENLCRGNIATSGAKSCNWNNGKCEDKVCSDAPTTYTTQQQCQNWINGCLTSGKGCALTLNPCSSYKKADGCRGMMGSDGPCVDNTLDGAAVCRKAECTDAPVTLSNNLSCQQFLAGCLSTGQGCVSALQTCSTYNQQQQCQSLIGSDGPCTQDTTEGSTKCRALKCTDAPTSLNSNSGCSQFLAGCVSTGYGCDNTLRSCSAYQGTSTTCDLIIGIDGKCRATSSVIQNCQRRLCTDAPSTTNTDFTCNLYQTGCVTTGAGCIDTLGPCNSYKGTSTTCTQYIGNDGNCAAPTNQLESGDCLAKICTDAPKTLKTNSDCQAYSYKCITNGGGCIQTTSCSVINQIVSCQGNPTCQSSQVCLNKSSCSNYTNQSQCLLNKQQYQQGGNAYTRPCVWSSGTCQNTLCSNLPTSLTTNSACSGALPGCLTQGQGCIDIGEPCTGYKGLTSTCIGFLGLNGTQKCTQLNTVTNTQTSCVIRTACSQAKTYSLSTVTYNSDSLCNSYFTSCYFDGKDNCTNGDCTTYFGTQTFCGNIKTAITSGKQQDCWKITNTSDSNSACIAKQCSQSPNTNNSNTLCDTFLKGCVWNGTTAGGCQDPSTACTTYSGSAPVCGTFSESNKLCSKSANLCKPKNCTNKQITSNLTTDIAKSTYCQQFKHSNGQDCYYKTGSTCTVPIEDSCYDFVAIGADATTKQNYCYNLKYPNAIDCGYVTGDYCTTTDCKNFIAVGGTGDAKLSYCQSIVISTDSEAGNVKCGLAKQDSTNCSSPSCTNYEIKNVNQCYDLDGCIWNPKLSICIVREESCNDYVIPLSYSDETDKLFYCNNPGLVCGYDSSISTTNCSKRPTRCDIIDIPSTTISVIDKAKFCTTFSVVQEVQEQCQYTVDLPLPAQCAYLAPCDAYAAYNEYQDVLPSDLDNQIFCSILKDADGNICPFQNGNKYCKLPQTSCSDYDTYGSTIIENQKLCKQYIASGIQCGSATAGTSKCKDLECGDYTQDSKCNDYGFTCFFDGVKCSEAKINCTDFIIENSIAGQQSCQLQQSFVDGPCGWGSGTTCQRRECSQLKTGQTAKSCKEYIFCDWNPSACCGFDGSGCMSKDNCATYVPQGETNSDKAAVCNNLIGLDGKCTFLIGNTNCVKTVANCAYSKPASATTDALAFLACSLTIDDVGVQCGYASGASQCSPRTCTQALVALNDADCNTHLSGCEEDPSTSCSSKSCSNAETTLTTNPACSSYRSGCVTNGNGCLESSEPCSSYKGTQTTCNGFTGNGILCTNTVTALSSKSCIDRDCTQNTTATKDSDCDTWYPPTATEKKCVWNGQSGCVPPSQCSSFTGTNDICTKVTATDGPCFRSATTSGACASTSSSCQSAPTTHNTDVLCKSWGSLCITNGSGCIAKTSATCASILTSTACSIYSSVSGLYCDLIDQCQSKPTSCNEYTNALDCNNIPLVGQDKITCGWNSQNSTCAQLTCDQLPVSLTTDARCSNIFSTCVTNGAGCVTKGPCASYSRQNCGNAVTTDQQKTCIWTNSGCRPIQCTDNTTAQTNSSCNSYLLGCKTTGAGCALTITCPIIKVPQLCLTDGSGLPCLWYKAPNDQAGTCISYSQCSDLIQSTHSACQAASPLCTTNGFTCVAVTSCSNTVLQASCIKGTDGNCGWLPAHLENKAQCQLYTECTAAKGTTLQQCKDWGQLCISDGIQCLQKSKCSTYTTQMACQSNGTDGLCFWVPSNEQNIAFCRLQLCSDATTNNLTHLGCNQFIPQTACTTSGQGCIQQGLCQSYNIQEGCVQGTDGVCFWEQQNNNPTTISSNLCRLKQCTDVIFTTSSFCQNAVNGIQCVSNGINCIKKSSCSQYVNREACYGGGLDGKCAFIPSTNSSDIGSCVQFTSCQVADQDQLACQSRSDACFFNQTFINGTATTSCQPHTCSTKQQGTQCLAVPQWDLSQYRICVLQGTTCVDGNTSQLTAQNCYQSSVATYTWNIATQSCQACVKTNSQINNTVNNSNNTDSSSYLVKIIFVVIWTI